jgi:hypothetical protein
MSKDDGMLDVQLIEFVQATAGTIEGRECVIMTIRPDVNSWRIYNVCLDAQYALSMRNRLNALFCNSQTLDGWMEREGIVLDDEYQPAEE